MMEGIVLAVLALLSVPVLLIVILVKVCGLENKVADLTKKVGGIDFTQRHRDTEKKVAVKVSAAKENVEKPISNSPNPTPSPSIPHSPFPQLPTNRRRSTCSGCESRTGSPFAATSLRRE